MKLAARYKFFRNMQAHCPKSASFAKVHPLSFNDTEIEDTFDIRTKQWKSRQYFNALGQTRVDGPV